jgi:hypothetical protein
LEKIKKEVLKKVPGCQVASDQAYREADLAIDFCEDIPPLPRTDVGNIARCFESAGAKAKISSIHVNGWFGDYDKLTMTGVMFEEVFAETRPTMHPCFSFFPTRSAWPMFYILKVCWTIIPPG